MRNMLPSDVCDHIASDRQEELEAFLRRQNYKELVRVFPEVLEATTSHQASRCARVMMESLLDLHLMDQNAVCRDWLKSMSQNPDRLHRARFALDHLPDFPSPDMFLRYAIPHLIAHGCAPLIHHPQMLHHHARANPSIWKNLDERQESQTKALLEENVTPEEVFKSLERLLDPPRPHFPQTDFSPVFHALVHRSNSFWASLHEKIASSSIVSAQISSVWPLYEDLLHRQQLQDQLLSEIPLLSSSASPSPRKI